MYPTNYLGHTELCKEIALTSQTEPGHWNYENFISQEDVELGRGKNSRGYSTETPNNN